MDVIGAIRRHPARTAVVVVLGLGLAVFGFLWFRPDKLFVDQRVDEALPEAPAAAAGTDDALDEKPEEPEEPAEPATLARGRFISLEHQTTGRVLVVEAPGGHRFLRFEDFETSNGPDLLVYLSAKEPSGTDDWYGYDEDFIDLGKLKGNIGNQNYRIPDDVDLDRYSTAVVWCRRFTVGFAAATLG